MDWTCGGVGGASNNVEPDSMMQFGGLCVFRGDFMRAGEGQAVLWGTLGVPADGPLERGQTASSHVNCCHVKGDICHEQGVGVV